MSLRTRTPGRNTAAEPAAGTWSRIAKLPNKAILTLKHLRPSLHIAARIVCRCFDRIDFSGSVFDLAPPPRTRSALPGGHRKLACPGVPETGRSEDCGLQNLPSDASESVHRRQSVIHWHNPCQPEPKNYYPVPQQRWCHTPLLAHACGVDN